jgi:DNA-directed RNA polymerase specialized sigma24 family protein
LPLDCLPKLTPAFHVSILFLPKRATTLRRFRPGPVFGAGPQKRRVQHRFGLAFARSRPHPWLMAHLEHSGSGVSGDFQHTRWSVVLAAGLANSPQAEEALSKLCQAYWKPVHAFICRRGHDAEEAKDLTQEFFYRLIEKEFLRIADRERGRFRTFLLACVEHFLAHERRKGQTLKRGGRYTFVPLDGAPGDDSYVAEPVDGMSPDKLFDQRWAWTLLEQAHEQLKQDYVAGGRTAQFEALEAFLSGATEAPDSYAEAGARCGLTEGAARQAAFRMRCRFGELLRMGVAQTVANPQDLEAELSHFRAVLSDPGACL